MFNPEFDPVLPTPVSPSTGPSRSDLHLIKGDIEKLFMITEALWTILKEKHGYNDEEIIRQMVLIDMRDGKLDGRVANTTGPQKCPKCERTLFKSRPRCLYCGEPVANSPFDR